MIDAGLVRPIVSAVLSFEPYAARSVSASSMRWSLVALRKREIRNPETTPMSTLEGREWRFTALFLVAVYPAWTRRGPRGYRVRSPASMRTGSQFSAGGSGHE